MTKKNPPKMEYDSDGVPVSDFHPDTGEVVIPLRRIRTPYDGVHIRHIIKSDPTKDRTKQEFKAQCDINRIVANFTKTGRLDQLDATKGVFADLSVGPQNYQEALNLVIHTRDAFDDLPSDIRNMFANDVQNFLYAAEHNPDELFKALEQFQIDGKSPATPVAPPPSEPPLAASNEQPNSVAKT